MEEMLAEKEKKVQKEPDKKIYKRELKKMKTISDVCFIS